MTFEIPESARRRLREPYYCCWPENSGVYSVWSPDEIDEVLRPMIALADAAGELAERRRAVREIILLHDLKHHFSLDLAAGDLLKSDGTAEAAPAASLPGAAPAQEGHSEAFLDLLRG